MTQPITVVIPTRERADTLRHCLQTVVAQPCNRLQILVSDNASSPATREVVDSFSDARIRYVNTGARLSMAHNYEFALGHVDSGWIVMLGDDDGLVAGRLEPTVAMLEASGLMALSSETCFYNWPKVTSDREPALTVPLSQAVVTVRSSDAVADILRLVRPKARLPQTYTGGIIHADVIRAARAKDGSFFQSQIPDIYSSFAITATVERYLYSKAPFAIAGRSSHSIGAALFKLEKNAFLEEGLIPFHRDFPTGEIGTLSFSMPAIQFECHTQAAFLHEHRTGVSKQRMLDLMMANTKTGRAEMLQWGRSFASLHGLDYDLAIRRMPQVRRESRMLDGWRSFRNLLECARLYPGDPMPLANVQEASETAAALLANPPSRAWSTVRTLKKRFV
ncbi:MAG: glycosyltransferase family 2 protein [Novosphingobium sp.]|uniref:glycosyltransferase family 2 protein n=1 Tax=Novosphingobium sp. TaxID=1874826 RepID=UPI0032BA315F